MTEATLSNLEAITRDLALIAEQGRWAHTHSYWKAGRGLDAERGASLRAPSDDERTEQRTNPDHVGGPRYDIDIGDHKTRAAYQQAIRAVTETDLTLARILQRQGVRLQLPVVRLDPYSPPEWLTAAIRAATWRASQVTDQRAHRGQLEHLRRLVSAAYVSLSVALGQGRGEVVKRDEDTTRPKDRCTVCDTYKRLPKSGGRCSVCRTWYRKTGKERVYISPRVAQRKRHDRGDGWGAA